jgi:Bardet-Biedl syndrome 1 protein
MLSLPNIEQVKQYVDTFKHAELKRQVVITCLAKLNKNSQDDDAINCLVVGSEQKIVYILDSEAFTILTTIDCPNIPAFLNVTGLYDVEYRIIVGCRDGFVHIFKRYF